MQKYKSIEQLDALTSPPNGTTGGTTPVTAKDQEALIQDLKKENFDLKLRLFMESKEFDKSIRNDKRTIDDLENEISEIVQELEGSLQREREYESELDAARRREKAFINKQRRLEQALREKDEEIQYLNKELAKLSIGTQNESFYGSEVNFKKFEEEQELEPEEFPNIDELKCKLFIDDGKPEQENDLNQSPEDNTKRHRDDSIGEMNHRNKEDNFTFYGKQRKQELFKDAQRQTEEIEDTSSVDDNDVSFQRHASIRGKRSNSSKHYHENNVPLHLKEKTCEKYREVCVDDGSSVERFHDRKLEGKDDGVHVTKLTHLTNLTDISTTSVPDVRLHEFHKTEKTTRQNKYLYNNGVLAGSQRSQSIDDLHKNQTKKDKKKKKGKLYKMLCCLTPKLSKEENGSLPRDYRPTAVTGQY